MMTIADIKSFFIDDRHARRSVPLALAFTVLFTAFGVYHARFGIVLQDEPYQILNALNYKDIPQAPLSAWCSYYIGSLFGYKWLGFRLFAQFMILGSVWLSCWYLYRQSRRLTAVMWFTAMLTLITVICRRWERFYGWDTYTFAGVAVMAVMCLDFLKHPRVGMAVALGVFGSVLTMMRLPNVVCLLVPPILMTDNGGIISDKFKWLICYVLSAAITLLAITCMLFGSPGGLAATLSENVYDSHGVSEYPEMMLDYVYGMAKFSFGALLLYATYFLVDKGSQRIDNRFVWVMFCLTPLLTTSWLVHHDFVNMRVLSLFLIYAVFVEGYKGKRRQAKLAAVTLLCLGCVPFVGSVLAAQKFMTFAFFPLSMAWLSDRITRSQIIFAGIVVLAIFPISFYREARQSFGDAGLLKPTSSVDYPLLWGMKTSVENAATVNSTISKFEASVSQSDDYMIVDEGVSKYYYQYYFNKRNPLVKHTWGGDV